MIDRAQIRGIVTPMITPLQGDRKSVDEAGVHQLVERLVRQGVHGVFPGGTTGEVWALDDEQWSRLVRFTVEACRGRRPVYAGVSHASTAGAIRRAHMAESMGVDVVVSLAPYYFAPTQADIVRHYSALASATPLPLLIYQFPGITKVSIEPATLAELQKIPNIVGVKDSKADVTEFQNLVRLLRGNGQDFRLFLGTDMLTDVAVMIGGQGTVPSGSNLGGAFLVEAYEAAEAGDWARARQAQMKFAPLQDIYRAGGETYSAGILAGLKCALNLLGINAGPPALPLPPCNAEQTRKIEGILRATGLL